MLLINCKAELKLKWTKYCVSAAAGDGNTNHNSNNIIFTMNDAKSLYQPKDNQKLSKLLGKRIQRSVYWSAYKTKSENKNTTNNYRYFIESNFVEATKLFVLIYPNQNDIVKRFDDKALFTKKYYQKL